MKFLSFALLSLVIAFNCGCARLITKRINRLYPPVSRMDNQLASVRENAVNLTSLSHPDAYIALTVTDLNRHFDPVLDDLVVDNNFVTVHVANSRSASTIQELTLTGNFDAFFKQEKIGVAGILSIHAAPGLVAPAVDPGSGAKLNFHLGVSSIHISRADLKQSKYHRLGWLLRSKPFLHLMNDLLNRFADNINGQLAVKPTSLEFDPIVIDPAKVPQDARVKITQSHPVTVPTSIKSAAILIGGNGLQALATWAEQRTVGQSQKSGGSPADLQKEFAEFETTFEGRAADAFGQLPRNTSELAVARITVSRMLNPGLQDLGFCASYAIEPKPQDKHMDLALPELDLHCDAVDDFISCSAEERCLPYFRTLAANNRSMNCDHWVTVTKERIIATILCPLCTGLVTTTELIHDVGCETAKKAAQVFDDTAKTIDAFADKAGLGSVYRGACKFYNSLDKPKCEALKAGGKGGCKLLQTSLNNAREIVKNADPGAKFGDLGGQLVKWNATISGCLKTIKFSDNLSAFQVSGDIGGDGNIDEGRLLFTPTVAGSAITGCVAPINSTIRGVHVSLKDHLTDFTGSITPDSSDVPPKLVLRIDPVDVTLHADPPPILPFVQQNPDFFLKCSAPAALPQVLTSMVLIETLKSIAGKPDLADFQIPAALPPLSLPLQTRLVLYKNDAIPLGILLTDKALIFTNTEPIPIKPRQ